MSRRIAYAIAIATCSAFIAPASADRECFENTCRMPEVVEPADAPVVPAEETAVAAGAANAVKKQERLPPAPEPPRSRTVVEQQRPGTAPVRPQMIVDQLPRPAPKPSPYRPAERVAESPALQDRAPRESGPIEIVGRRYAAVEASAYAQPNPTQPGAGVDVLGEQLQNLPLPREILHELGRQLDRVPLDAVDAGHRRLVDPRQHVMQAVAELVE